MSTLNILTWNVRRIMSSSNFLAQLLDTANCDIAIICEHKLKPPNSGYLDTKDHKYSSNVHIESDPSHVGPQNQCERFVGKSGLEMMYRKELRFYRVRNIRYMYRLLMCYRYRGQAKTKEHCIFLVVIYQLRAILLCTTLSKIS